MSICQIEERRAGRAYPRTCPTCRLGPCQRGHWKGTKPPAQKPAPTDAEVMAHPKVKALVGLLTEARADLADYVAHEWPEETRAKYPDIGRRYRRDMDLCWRIDVALAALKRRPE